MASVTSTFNITWTEARAMKIADIHQLYELAVEAQDRRGEDSHG